MSLLVAEELGDAEGRSFHAFATDAEEARGPRRPRAGKTEETMRRIYRQPKPDEKAALAMQLDTLRRGA